MLLACSSRPPASTPSLMYVKPASSLTISTQTSTRFFFSYCTLPRLQLNTPSRIPQTLCSQAGERISLSTYVTGPESQSAKSAVRSLSKPISELTAHRHFSKEPFPFRLTLNNHSNSSPHVLIRSSQTGYSREPTPDLDCSSPSLPSSTPP